MSSVLKIEDGADMIILSEEGNLSERQRLMLCLIGNRCKAKEGELRVRITEHYSSVLINCHFEREEGSEVVYGRLVSFEHPYWSLLWEVLSEGTEFDPILEGKSAMNEIEHNIFFGDTLMDDLKAHQKNKNFNVQNVILTKIRVKFLGSERDDLRDRGSGVQEIDSLSMVG